MLRIRRAGIGDELTVSLVRETIRTEPLRWSMEGDVLVLRVEDVRFEGGAVARVAFKPNLRILEDALATASTLPDLSAGTYSSDAFARFAHRRIWQANDGDGYRGFRLTADRS